MKESVAPRIGIGLAIAALLLLAPKLLTVVQTRMLVEIAYFALFAVSFNLLFAYAGLLSFGHAAYFGLGAYVTALALKQVEGMPFLLAVVSGGIAGALGGAIIGFFAFAAKVRTSPC